MTPFTIVRNIATRFQISGEFVSAQLYGTGHIHDTYRVEFRQSDLNELGLSRYTLLQRINTHVFPDPMALMENIQRVTDHLLRQLSPGADQRQVLRLIPNRDGRNWHIDFEGSYWRAYHYIENTLSCDMPETADQAYQAARAFGRFQLQLATLPAPRLLETIPDFHHTPRRYQALERAIDINQAHRAANVAAEIAFAESRKTLAGLLQNADLPERVAHNDSKLANVLLDSRTGEGLCVVDLDTVMPGFAVHDFGDLVRTITSPVAEDEQNLTLVRMQFPMFEAVARGYLSTAGSFLTQEEKNHLVPASKVLVYEQGLRFLTDHLNGDTYYKILHPDHNLHRCRTQFALLQSMERQEAEMTRLIRALG